MDTPTQHLHRRTALLALAICLIALPFLTLTQPAAADVSFCPPGTGAGQCSSELQGLATGSLEGAGNVVEAKAKKKAHQEKHKHAKKKTHPNRRNSR